MATLGEILSALLSDIAAARTEADMATREAAERYRQDPILRLMPVPRIDVRALSVDLPFVVERVEAKQADHLLALRAIARREAETISDKIAALEVRRTQARNPELLSKVIGEAGLKALIVDVQNAADGVVVRRASQFVSQPDVIAKDLQTEMRGAIVARIKAVGGIVLPKETNTRINELAATYAEGVINRARDAISPTSGDRTLITVAVTPDKLASLPEGSLARVRLEVAVENYEWTTRQGAEGGEIDTLVPR